MSTNLNLALTLNLKDQLVGPLQRAVADASKKLEELEKGLGKIGATGDQSAQKLTNLAGKADALGKSPGATKLKTDLAGVGQAADDATRKTGKLKDLLGQLPNVARGVVSAFAGISAGKMVLAAPLQRAADYELNLARASNIAYADRKTVAGRQAGQREMDQSVRTATVQGVTRDDALLGLKTLISAGTDRKDAMTLLPTLAKFSMAGEADMKDVANIAIKAQQTYGISPAQMPAAMQMALNAGKVGQFEFKDMAQWLPEQMAISKNMLGMQGLGDMATLLTANQFAAKSTGSNNAAGNNLVNFLGKINSDDTRNDAKKLDIDLTGTLVKARSQGMNPIDAFVSLMKMTAEKDPEYQKIQGRLKNAQASGDKKGEAETLGAMRDLMMGKSIGKLVQDRQALLGLLGILNDPKGFDSMRQQIRDTQGGVDVDQATLMATASMKNMQGDNAELNRQFDALQGVNGALGDAKVKIAQLSAEYPNAAAGLEALKLAAYAAGVGLAGMGLMNLATGGGAGVAGKIAGTVGGAAMAVGAAGLAGAVGYGAGTLLYKGALEGNAGGDAIGAGVARLLAFFGNDEAKASVASSDKYDAQMASEQAAREAQAKEIAQQQAQQMLAAMSPVISRMESLASRPIMVTLDGQVLADSTNSKNSRVARRN